MTDTNSMLSSIPADLFAGAENIPEPHPEGVDDAPVEDAPVEDAPVEDAPVDDTPAAAEEPAAEEPVTSAEPEPAAAATSEELPEGVTKGKDSKGRPKYFLEENRYKTVYGNHQLVQQATELLGGEPLTLDALKLRNDALLGNERLFNNLTSGDPAAQADVVKTFLGEMKLAMDQGEVGSDPAIPFAETVYQTLQAEAPDAFAHLRMTAGRDLVADMFDHAARTGDDALASSIRHVARALAGIGPKPADVTDAAYLQHVREVTERNGIPFYTPQEVKTLVRSEEPLTAAQRRIQELEAQVNGRQTTSAAEQYRAWDGAHTKAVNDSVDTDVVVPALSSVADAWKAFPDDYQKQVVEPLKRDVITAIKGDPVLRQRVADLRQRAQMAATEQARNRIGEEIKQLVINRARLAVDQAKAPILKTAAEWFTWRNQQTHARKASAQTRTAPQGQSTPVRQSALPTQAPFKNGLFDSQTAMKQALAAINGR